MAHYLDTNTVFPVDNTEIFAEKLVKRLGVKDALRMCRENSWDGVIHFIKGHVSNDIK